MEALVTFNNSHHHWVLWRERIPRKGILLIHNTQHNMPSYSLCDVIQVFTHFAHFTVQFVLKQWHNHRIFSEHIHCSLPDKSRVHVSSHGYGKVVYSATRTFHIWEIYITALLARRLQWLFDPKTWCWRRCSRQIVLPCLLQSGDCAMF